MVVIQSKMEDQAIKYFCYITINNQTQLILQCTLIGLSLLLVGDAFRKFYRMRGSHNSHVTFVYRLLLAWWIAFVLSNSYGATIFALKDNNNEKYSDGDMSLMTKYYFVIDWINAFLIQWLLLYLPYQWSKQVSELFDAESTGKKSEIEFEEPQKISKYKGYETKIYKTLKHYMKVRLAYFILPIVFICLSKEVILFKMMVTCLLIDCIFITLSLILGMVSMKTTEQLKQQLDEQQSKRVFNQYLLVIIANTIRFGFDLSYVIAKVFNDSTYGTKCPDLDEDNLALNIAFNIITCLLTYYLPVFIILRIYNLEEKPELICQSLIISHEDGSDER